MEAHVERWSQQKDNLEGRKQRVEDNLDRNRSKLYTARGDFASVVEGWIDEGYDELQKIERWIRELDEKIARVQSKLR
jgi:predicted  nucleic acid-binding Zn-ribbon protein